MYHLNLIKELKKVTNNEKLQIIFKQNISRQDIVNLTNLHYKAASKIFSYIRNSVLVELRKDDPNFDFYNTNRIPTLYALPYLKKYGVDKKEILKNAEIEKELF